jgi:NTE family protein
MKLGLSLSGGGFRATVFHLGVLARLAEEGRLKDVTLLSTVSGGSLCVGLVYACNGFRWPASGDFVDNVVPRARQLLTSQDLQLGLIGRVLRFPLRVFGTRADDLSFLLNKRWGVKGSLRALPDRPRWMINATCYETGKNWRFERSRMGDNVFGYTHDTNLPLSDALAASAGFPALIGPLHLDTHVRSWFKYTDEEEELRESVDPDRYDRQVEPTKPAYSRLHLWDGGVYDNLGLEGLHNFVDGWRHDVDFLIISDACERLKPEKHRPWKASLRMIRGIMMDQVRTLRFRAVSERLINHEDAGSFLQIGSTCEQVLRDAGREVEIANLCPRYLTGEEADRAAEMRTDIGRLSREEFELLFRHGFEVADYTLYANHPDEFNCIGYGDSRRCAMQQHYHVQLSPASP